MVVWEGENGRGRDSSDDATTKESMPFAIENPASRSAAKSPSEPSRDPAVESPADSSHEPNRQLSAEPIEIPLVMPGGRATPFWRRRGRALTLLVAAIVLVVAGRFLSQRFTGAGSGSAATFSSISLEELAPELRVVAETFQGAVVRYAERTEDFDLGRLGCDGLWTGYRGVEEAFVSLSEQNASVGGGVAADRVFESSRRSMEEIERRYEASECPRGN
jgi:hypothetical protein